MGQRAGPGHRIRSARLLVALSGERRSLSRNAVFGCSGVSVRPQHASLRRRSDAGRSINALPQNTTTAGRPPVGSIIGQTRRRFAFVGHGLELLCFFLVRTGAGDVFAQASLSHEALCHPTPNETGCRLDFHAFRRTHLPREIESGFTPTEVYGSAVRPDFTRPLRRAAVSLTRILFRGLTPH